MAEPTCATCPFFSLAAERRGYSYDACRRRPPDAVLTIADHSLPQAEPDDLCGEHPEHPEQLHRLAERLAVGMLSDEAGGEGGFYRPHELASRAYEMARALQAEATKIRRAGHA